MTLNQGHMVVRNQKLLHQLPHKVLMYLDGIWYAVEALWYNEHDPHFISSVFKGENETLVVLYKKKFGIAFGHLQTDFLQTGYDDSHHQSV